MSLKLNKKIILIVCILVISIISVPVVYAYYTTTGEFSGSAYVSLPDFAPSVNDSSSLYQDISLADTITNDKYLAPGAKGKFKLDIDLSDVGTNAYYKIEFDRQGIPNNLHFYVDKEMTKELGNIEGGHLLSNTNRIAENIIYWQWELVDSEYDNYDDNLYLGNQIVVPFEVYVAQNFEEKELVLVNDSENPTGRINLGTTSGNFNMKLDFSRFNDSGSYNVYFDKDNLGDIHLYSDSEYQNEITSLSGTFSSSNSVINTPLYWRCEGTCSSGGLYYIVYLS